MGVNAHGSLNNVGSNGNYWSAGPYSTTNGYNLNFNSGSVNPTNNNNRANGFSVRSVSAFTLCHRRSEVAAAETYFLTIMALYSDLPVFKATYDLLLLTYKKQNQVPRELRYTLVREITQRLIDMLSLIFQANATREKLPLLAKARTNMEEVKIRFRLLSDLHLLGARGFADIIAREESISKQLASWYNSAAKATIDNRRTTQ